LQQSPDFGVWHKNLVDSGADFLFVAKSGPTPPPELALIAQRPAAFEVIRDDPAAVLYRIRDGALSPD
jgi:hypothetical protein